MEKYSAHWATTILAAIVLHILAAAGFVYVLPSLASAPKVNAVAEMEWVDVDLTDDAAFVADEEAIPADAPQETVPTFDANDLVLPELQIPQPIIEPPKPTPPAVKPIEQPKPQPLPPTVDDKPKPPPQAAQAPAKENVTPADNRQVVTRPPITVKEVYPEKGSVLGFKGYISFAAHISKDGKVTATEILQSSGRYFVDEIARKAAEQWTFKPALDQRGRPMECDKIITFDFRKAT